MQFLLEMKEKIEYVMGMRFAIPFVILLLLTVFFGIMSEVVGQKPVDKELRHMLKKRKATKTIVNDIVSSVLHVVLSILSILSIIWMLN